MPWFPHSTFSYVPWTVSATTTDPPPRFVTSAETRGTSPSSVRKVTVTVFDPSAVHSDVPLE
jgi:hypothetical protein